MENIPMNPSRIPQSPDRGLWTQPSAPRPPLVPIPVAETVPMPAIIPPPAPVMPAEPAEPAGPIPEATPAPDRMNHYSDRTGELPQSGMLANVYVPWQRPGTKYSQNEGLKKGTLFPGLDLPFKNYIASREVANTPMGELMAIGFAMSDLGLYLDTHPDDMEALKLRNKYVRMYKEARKAYEQQYGPISHAAEMEKYTWVHSPWPWEVK